jgi:hypothetical protein
MTFFETDLNVYPALALTLVEVKPQEVSPKFGVANLDEAINIGKVRAEIVGSLAPTKVSCRTSPSCTGSNNFSCANSNATTWFVVNKVLIETKHEGGFFSKPEIEMYIAPFQHGSSTTLIFDGGSIIDPAGDSRSMPDINKKNKWYTINGGLAIEPFGGSFSLIDLIEDDDTKGVYIAIPDDEFAGQVFATESSFSCNQTTKDFDPSGTDFRVNASIRCIETNCNPMPPSCGTIATFCTASSDCCSPLQCRAVFGGLQLCLN